MDGIMNDNQLTIVKEYEFDNSLIKKIDSIIDNSIRDCHNKYFHTFDHICENDSNFKISLIMKQLISQFLIKAWVCMN